MTTDPGARQLVLCPKFKFDQLRVIIEARGVGWGFHELPTHFTEELVVVSLNDIKL